MKLADTFQLLQIRNQIMDKKLPIKTSYKFTRFFEELEKESKYFNDTFQNLIDEYGEKDENGEYILTEDKKGVQIKKEKLQECMDKINELNDIEVHLEYEPKFTLEELDGLDLEMKYISLLMPYISED
jgi:hypothetical protein